MTSLTSPNTTRSVIAAEALIEQVGEKYGISGPVTCRLHTVGDNDTYLVQAGAMRYVLRVYYPDRFWLSGIDEYRFELELLRFCHEQGLPVSHPVARQDGELLNELTASDGARPWALFSHAPGNMVFPMSIDQFRAYGEHIAMFHIKFQDFKSSHKRFHYGVEVLIERPLEILSEFFGVEDQGVVFLRTLAPEMARRFESLSVSNDAYGIIGGDFHGANHHVDDDGQMTFFDFDFCGYGFRAYDLAVLRHNARLGGWDPGIANAVLEGYESQRPLSEEELRSMPLFMMARRIWRLATRARECEFKGRSTFRTQDWEAGIDVLREWRVETEL